MSFVAQKWYVAKDKGNPRKFIMCDGERLATVRYIQGGKSISGFLPSETRSIAKLMAAAPELLESLKTAVGLVELRYGNNDPIVEPFLEKARTLITAVER